LPLEEYRHPLGYAITGGCVYRGLDFPWLNGIYFYGDFYSGRLWALRLVGSDLWRGVEMLNTAYQISSFDEDERGELYLLDFTGGDCTGWHHPHSPIDGRNGLGSPILE